MLLAAHKAARRVGDVRVTRSATVWLLRTGTRHAACASPCASRRAVSLANAIRSEIALCLLASRPLCTESSSVSFFVILSRPVIGWGVAVRPRTVKGPSCVDPSRPRPGLHAGLPNIGIWVGWAGWLPRCNACIAGHRPHPFCALFPPPRELQCVRPVDRNDKSIRPPRTPWRPCDRTRRVSNTCTRSRIAHLFRRGSHHTRSAGP